MARSIGMAPQGTGMRGSKDRWRRAAFGGLGVLAILGLLAGTPAELAAATDATPAEPAIAPPLVVLNGVQAAWANHHDWLVYTRRSASDPTATEVVISENPGHGERVLASLPYLLALARFAPDDRHVIAFRHEGTDSIYYATGTVVAIDVATGQVGTLLPSDVRVIADLSAPDSIAVSSSGRWIAFVTEDAEHPGAEPIVAYDTEARHSVVVARPDHGALAVPQWLPGGDGTLAYGEWTEDTMGLWLRDLDGRAARPVPGVISQTPFRWVTGSAVLITEPDPTTHADYDPPRRIVRVDIDGGQRVELTAIGLWLLLGSTPDGRIYAAADFAESQDGLRATIVVGPTDRAGAVPVWRGVVDDPYTTLFRGNLNPAGTRLAVSWYTRDDEARIEIVEVPRPAGATPAP